MAESAGDSRKQGEDEPPRLRLDQSKGESCEAESPRPKQDRIEGGSSTAEYPGTSRITQRNVEVEQASPELEAESTYGVFLISTKSNDSSKSAERSDDFFRFVGRPDDYTKLLRPDLASDLFAQNLSSSLKAEGIRVFRDVVTLDTSEKLPPSVYSSKIYIPIFSKKNAHSPHCLNALALMVDLTSQSGGKKDIVPVFFDVKRSDVKLETSLYSDVLDTNKQNLGKEKVEQWKKALVEVGNVKGWELGSYDRYITSSFFFFFFSRICLLDRPR